MKATISYASQALLVSVFLIVLTGTFAVVANADITSKESGQGLVLDTDGGFNIASKNGRYAFNIGSTLQYDYRREDGALTRATLGEQNENYDPRRLRLNLSGHAAGWEFKLGYDFEDAASQDDDSGVTDAYVRYTGFGNWAILTFGRYKVPFSQAELTSSKDILAMERNVLTQAFAPARQEGIGLGGYSRFFSYNVSVWREEKNRGENADTSYGARVTWAPLYDKRNVAVHVGIAALKRDISVDGSAGIEANALSVSARTEARGADRLLSGPLVYDGIDTVGFEFGFANQGILFQAEYMESEYGSWSVESGNPVDLGGDFNGYSAQFAWVVTGESHVYDYKNGTFKRISPNTEGGAWEVFVRYSDIDLRTDNEARAIDHYNPNAGSGVNTPIASISSDNYSATTYGVNWYANANVRVSFNYIVANIERTNVVITVPVGASTPPPAIGSSSRLPLTEGDSVAIRLQYVF